MKGDDSSMSLSKKERSEQARQEAVQRKREEAKRQREVVKQSIEQVDKQQQSKRTVFADDSDEEEEKSNGKASSSKMQLFDDEDEDGEPEPEEQLQLKINNRHKGDKGMKLMKLEATFGNDPRFKFDEKFASSSDSEQEQQDDYELSKEKKKQKELLARILGRSLKEKELEGHSQRPPFTRFDPSNPQHVQWVEQHTKKKEEKSEKKEKSSKQAEEEELSSEDSEDESADEEKEKNGGKAVEAESSDTEEGEYQANHRIEVEMDNSFAEELRKKLQGEAAEEKFSFLSMIRKEKGLEHAVGAQSEESDDSEEKEAVEVKEKPKEPSSSKKTKLLRKFLGEEEGESNIERIGDVTQGSASAPETKQTIMNIFFIDGTEPQIKSVVENFRRTQTIEKVATKWASYRDAIMKTYKSKKKDAARKKRADWSELTKGRNRKRGQTNGVEDLQKSKKNKRSEENLQVFE